MSSPAVFATPDDGILDVMEMLVDKGISGLPICSERACSPTRRTGHWALGIGTLPCLTQPCACAGDDGHVLGIVSGYDLLAVDSTPGRLDPSLDATYLFPPVNLCALLETLKDSQSTPVHIPTERCSPSESGVCSLYHAGAWSGLAATGT